MNTVEARACLQHSRPPTHPLSCAQVMARIQSAPALRRALALALLAVSHAFVRARRVLQGTAVQYALTPRPLHALVGAFLVSPWREGPQLLLALLPSMQPLCPAHCLRQRRVCQ